MVSHPGGTYVAGSDEGIYPLDGEGPQREVSLSPFAIGAHAVTNADFAAFVAATGYLTDAERAGSSFVFYQLVDPSAAVAIRGYVVDTPWWADVRGACWHTPEGGESSIEDRLEHPVVHVSHNDAGAYCAWIGARLPTEAEWECAARDGLEQRRYPWGDELTPEGGWRCNIWQGSFPRHNTGEDGFIGTAPVDSFPPSGLGLYNIVGNVWEWCADWFAPGHPSGPLRDPAGPVDGAERVIRGGSYLCHASYCFRYRVAARSSNTPDSTTGHMGFRVARSVFG